MHYINTQKITSNEKLFSSQLWFNINIFESTFFDLHIYNIFTLFVIY